MKPSVGRWIRQSRIQNKKATRESRSSGNVPRLSVSHISIQTNLDPKDFPHLKQQNLLFTMLMCFERALGENRLLQQAQAFFSWTFPPFAFVGVDVVCGLWSVVCFFGKQRGNQFQRFVAMDTIFIITAKIAKKEALFSNWKNCNHHNVYLL